MRFYRTVMLDEMQSDYVRTAFAKGFRRVRCCLSTCSKRDDLIITNVVLSIPYWILGLLPLERSIPGLGDLMIQAINSRDFLC